MVYFEEKSYTALIEAETLLYLRFIDDSIKLWTKSEEDQQKFLDKLITKNTSIKFKFKYSRQL